MNLGSSGEARLKERFREATRLALLDAAEAAFASHGLEGARVDDIAAVAGVSVGTLYNHFGDRRQLLEALLEGRRQELVARIDEELREGEEVPFARLLERFVRTLLGHFDAHRALFQLLMEEEASHSRSRKRKTSMLRDLVLRAEQLVARGLSEGALREKDAEHFPVLLVSLVRGMLASGQVARVRGPVEEVAPVILQLFLQGARR